MAVFMNKIIITNNFHYFHEQPMACQIFFQLFWDAVSLYRLIKTNCGV